MVVAVKGRSSLIEEGFDGTGRGNVKNSTRMVLLNHVRSRVEMRNVESDLPGWSVKSPSQSRLFSITGLRIKAS